MTALHCALATGVSGWLAAVLQGTGLAVYTAETALRNYLTTGGSLFSAPGESPDSYRAVANLLMIVSSSKSPALQLHISLLLANAILLMCTTTAEYVRKASGAVVLVDRATARWLLSFFVKRNSSASILGVVACCSRC